MLKRRGQADPKPKVTNTADGKASQATSWDDVAGCLNHLAKGQPAPTDEQMRAAVRQMAAQRYRRSVARP